MSWFDPIVEEVRQARDAYAARFNYDLRAIARDLKEQEKRSGRQVVAPAKVGEKEGHEAPLSNTLAPENASTPQPAISNG